MVRRSFFFGTLLHLLSVHFLYSQNLEYAKSIVQTLASDEYAGRGYVEGGLQKSADFIAKEFKTLGIEPVSESGFYQKFQMQVNTFPSAMEIRIDGRKLKAGEDYIVSPSSMGLRGSYSVIQVKRSDLIFKADLLKVVKKAYGAVLLIDMIGAEKESKDETESINKHIELLKYAEDIDLKALILRSEDKLTWSVAMFQSPRLIVEVRKQLSVSKRSEIFFDIESNFIDSFECKNVAGLIKGTEKPDSIIAFTAHYDHLGKMGAGVVFPGANDNASGIALLLSLAKHYSVHKPKYTLLFIALAGEEAGLLGAKAFVADPPVELEAIRFLINFDLAGTGDEGVKVVNGSVYKGEFDRLKLLNNQYGLLPEVRSRSEACISDHCMFYRQSVPSFYIYTQGGIQAYHDIYDKYETLPFTEFEDYLSLMTLFTDNF